MTIKYPTWRIKGVPTPNEKLVICDTCGNAKWINHTTSCGPDLCINSWDHPNGKMTRMREATAVEYQEGKSMLKKEIG